MAPRKVVLVTHIAFWRFGYGRISPRMRTLAAYLDERTEFTVVYGGTADPRDEERIRELRLNVVFLEKESELTPEEYAGRFRQYLLAHPPDVCIVEYLELAFLLDHMPPGIITMLDTHDIASDREDSFRAFGIPCGDVSWAEEVAMYRRFDYVILITGADRQKTARELKADQLILAPHPVAFARRPLRERATSLGFVATEYVPNRDAINWFIANVWPQVYRPGLTLDIYGNVSRCVADPDAPGVRVHGFAASLDQVYGSVDLVINPVRFGAGLKVKNVEALGNGLPLLTTSHGAIGLEEGAGKAFRVADRPGDFAQHVLDLLDHYPARQALGQNAYHFARSRFSADVCFGELLEAIHAVPVASHGEIVL